MKRMSRILALFVDRLHIANGSWPRASQGDAPTGADHADSRLPVTRSRYLKPTIGASRKRRAAQRYWRLRERRGRRRIGGRISDSTAPGRIGLATLRRLVELVARPSAKRSPGRVRSANAMPSLERARVVRMNSRTRCRAWCCKALGEDRSSACRQSPCVLQRRTSKGARCLPRRPSRSVRRPAGSGTLPACRPAPCGRTAGRLLPGGARRSRGAGRPSLRSAG